jgi:3-methyl-2-oxobutanoate hydroxymethyltransferase
MKITTSAILKRKMSAQPITMLTAYDYPTASILDGCGVDVVLVGDSVGATVLGYDNISRVSMDDMLHHIAAVKRGIKHALIIGDMPYRSYATPALALRNARRFVKCGAEAVKMEGGAKILKQIELLRKNGIPVCGHLGYLPQSGAKPGVVGKTIVEAKRLINDAELLQGAGAFMIVLELVPLQVVRHITRLLRIPTIGIGAGPFCDGQVQVWHDILGLSPKTYKHSKVFANGKVVFSKAVSKYVNEVRKRSFPTRTNAARLDDNVMQELRDWIKNK